MKCIPSSISLVIVWPSHFFGLRLWILLHIFPDGPTSCFLKDCCWLTSASNFPIFLEPNFLIFFENKKKEKVSQPSQFHVCSTTSLSENKLLYLFVFSLIPAWDFTLICFQGVLKPQMSCNCCSIGFQGVLKPQMSRSNGCFHFLISTIFPPQLFQIYALCVDSCLPSNSR